MIPVLFEADETAYITSGQWSNVLAFLSDAISCEMVEERNGKYELTMTYPASGIAAKEITNNRLIGIRRPAPSGRNPLQVFRIYSIGRAYSGMMTVYAQHISYVYAQTPWFNKSAGGSMWDTSFLYMVDNVANAISGLNYNLSQYNDSIQSVPITSDITTTLSVPRLYPPADLRSIRNCIGGQDGSMIDLFGGELEWDNLDHVYLNSARGEARDYYVEYGVNIIDATMEQNIAECYTGVVATWRYSDPETGNAWTCFAVKEAANVSSFPVKRWYIYDCTGNENLRDMKPDSQAARAAILAKVQGLANTKAQQIQVGVPRISINVNFADLLGTKEYKQYRSLEQFYLCDTVNVKIPMYNVETTAKITSITWDVLKERYLNMQIGDASVATLADTINSMGVGTTNVYNSVINEPYVAGTNIDITNYVVSVANIGDTVRASGSVSVANSTTVTTHTITITAGTWLITGYIQWGAGFSQSYNHNVICGSKTHTVRNVGTNGGGSSNVMIVEVTGSTSVTQSAWQNSGSAKSLSATSELMAIRIK